MSATINGRMSRHGSYLGSPGRTYTVQARVAEKQHEAAMKPFVECAGCLVVQDCVIPCAKHAADLPKP